MEWQPIETAPKDELVLLHRPTAAEWCKVAPGKWEPDAYSTKPKPYWRIWLCIGGVTDSRQWMPTAWMPLPAPPTETT